MKRFGFLYENIYERKALRYSHYETSKGLRDNEEVIKFETNLGYNLTLLQRELESETYRISGYKVFFVREPKLRLIMSVPYRDRVVQDSACRTVLIPIIDRHLISTNCANRIGMGTHYALNILQKQMIRLNNQHPGKELYFINGDIKAYFYSISHARMKRKVRRLIKDPKMLRLTDHFIESGENYGIEEKKRLGVYKPGYGIPAGLLASQPLSSYYLSDMDHFIKEELKIEHFVRCGDDFRILHHGKDYLKMCMEEIKAFLAEEELMLNQKSQVASIKQGIDFLGFKNYLTDDGRVIRKLKRDNVRKVKKKVKYFSAEYAAGNMELEKIKSSVQGWLGHARFGNTYRLRENVLSKLILRRDNNV